MSADRPAETRLESAEDIRQALLAAGAKKPATPGAATQAAEPAATVERPVKRPPMALLCLLDDGKLDGEWVRLRADRTVIGRGEGDVRVPHDFLMSTRHAEIVRQPSKDGGRWIWVLHDLGSTNGTFVRIGSTLLRGGNEILVGGGRYRFDAAGAPSAAEPEAPTGSTRAWTGSSAAALVPSLIEILPSGPGPRTLLTLPEYWIGRDAKSCALARPDDVLAEAKHVRLHRDARGWWAENNKSMNGLWLRVAGELPLGGNCQVRMGEQRFLFRVG